MKSICANQGVQVEDVEKDHAEVQGSPALSKALSSILHFTDQLHLSAL
jgi:hypothetical protein